MQCASRLTTRGRAAQRRAVTPDVVLRRATIDEILDVRHAVLRPGLPLDTARFEGDDELATRHFGAFLPAGENVACISCMRRSRAGLNAWQVRGMATRADLTGQGIGTALLGFAVAALREDAGPRLLWCNARVSAMGFWERAGWVIASDVFDIAGVGPHRVLELRI